MSINEKNGILLSVDGVHRCCVNNNLYNNSNSNVKISQTVVYNTEHRIGNCRSCVT